MSCTSSSLPLFITAVLNVSNSFLSSGKQINKKALQSNHSVALSWQVKNDQRAENKWFENGREGTR